MLSNRISLIVLFLLMNFGMAGPAVCFSSDTDAGVLVLTPHENAWLKSHPVIRIGTMENWPPLNYVEDGGQPMGIGADYITLLNRRLTGALIIRPGPFKKNFEQVRKRQLDALMDITPKKERRPFFNFTRPYLKIPHVIVGRKNGPYFESEQDLKGKTVALEKGFFNIRYFQNTYPEVGIREYESTSEALGAVSRSEADAYAGNRAVVIYLIERELMGNLQIQGRMDKPPVVLSIGVRKDWPELAAILDKALASITIEEERQIRNNWLQILPGRDPGRESDSVISPDQVAYLLKSMALVFAGIFTIILMAWLALGQPRKVSIRSTLFGILFIFAGLTVSIGVLAVLFLNLEKQVGKAENRLNQYIDLAHELKQSSDDLTRFARTFVVTGKAEYESYFQDILDIRDGIIPHPVNNTPAFWDHVAAGGMKPEYRGETYSIEQRMEDLGLSEEERRELSYAKKESDDLTTLEAVGMNAVKGLFDDGQGNFTEVRKPEREMARQLLHGEAYHLAKAKMTCPLL
ncbi:MAG: transporter substrate-binding domain-containing protein [Desulfobacter sp.]|nr:MAG: transporter substrate-binding domain-containing protein [Desulfobacter sp.]